MRALVTGASGFIGSNLVDRLLAEGVQVKCLVRPRTNLTWLGSQNLTLVPGDFHDPASLTPAIGDVDVVFHVAGATRAARRADTSGGTWRQPAICLRPVGNMGLRIRKFCLFPAWPQRAPV